MASPKSKGLLAGLIVVALVAAVALGWFLSQPRTPAELLDRQAEEYVLLALGLGELKEGEVDLWFGPAGLLEEAQDNNLSLAEIRSGANTLAEEIAATIAIKDAPEIAARQERLLAKTRHLITLADLIAAPSRPAFADEIASLYGITLATSGPNQPALDQLENLLPGKGTLAFKLASYQNRNLVPADKRQAVFEAALAECQSRTAKYWNLPESETLDIEWTRDVQAAWHEYEGNFTSSMKINALTVALVNGAVDLACHEAYPGHHAQYALLEQAGKLALEDRVVLLRSPESVLREGAANVGIELAFPAEERLAFTRDVLYPIAGLSKSEAITSFQIHQLVTELSSAIVPVIREYYDGDIDFNAASFRLEREAMVTSPIPLLEFVNDYGTYSMGYTVVRDLLDQYIAANTQTAAQQWQLLQELLMRPAPDAIAAVQGE